MDDRNSRAAEDFTGACLASACDDGAADRAAASPALQRAVLGAAPEANGNIRCAARHDGFACSGPEAHDGIHWNGALWWDGEHVDAPAAEEVVMLPTEAGDTMAEVLRGVERLIALRGAISICPAAEAVSFDETLARLAVRVGVPVPERWSALDGVRA